MSNLMRDRRWRRQLDSLIAEQGVSLKYVADYIGAPYNGSETVFYAKLPQKRKRFIGIGMALKQPLDTINKWISEYSNYHALYIKDITEDLIWIYLIGLNLRSDSQANYFNMYDECREAALAVYTGMWDEFARGSIDTPGLELAFKSVSYDDRFEGLREFMIDHMDSFRTAYSKPRNMLGQYLDCILDPEGRGEPARTLNSLRGDLDDSMINYLSGKRDSIHTAGSRAGFKSVPKSRKSNIRLCLALGMTVDEINRYLELMGFSPLKADGDEGMLADMLAAWEKSKPLQRRYKDMRICGIEGSKLSSGQRTAAAQEMIRLRRDLQAEYRKKGFEFPYG